MEKKKKPWGRHYYTDLKGGRTHARSYEQLAHGYVMQLIKGEVRVTNPSPPLVKHPLPGAVGALQRLYTSQKHTHTYTHTLSISGKPLFSSLTFHLDYMCHFGASPASWLWDQADLGLYPISSTTQSSDLRPRYSRCKVETDNSNTHTHIHNHIKLGQFSSVSQ